MADWRKTVGWTAASIGALLLIVIVGGLLLLRSQAFHNYLISKIMQQASEATGARVELQNLIIHVKTLTADAYGLVIHGTEAPADRPLLQVQHTRLGVKIISIFHRKVNLSELIVENPVVSLVVNKQGQSNLPQPPPTNKKSSSTNVFDLAVGHVLLAHGQIYLKDRKIPVDANLTNLRTEITFSQLAKKYSGTLGYQSGLIHYAQLKPLPHRLQATFDATPSELNFKPLLLTIGGSRFTLQATVRDYSNTPVANGRYDFVLHTQDFAGLSSANAAGDVALAGTLNYKDVPNQPLLKNVSLSGDLNCNGLALSSPQAVVKIQKIAGRYQLANGNFKTDAFVLDLLNGRLTADGTMEHLDATPTSRFHLAITGISLQALKASLRNAGNQSVPVTGAIDATADASWKGSVSNVKANSTIAMHGSVVAANQSTSQTFPLNANIHVNYDGPRNLIVVPASSVQLPATSITAHGEVGNNSNLVINAFSSNLHQLMLLASSLQAPRNQSSTDNSANPPNIQGAATLNAVVQGTLQNPKIIAQASANQLKVNRSEWSSLQFGITASPSEVSIQNASLVSARQGQLNFSGNARLRRWSYQPSDPIAATLQIRQIAVAELQQIANVSYPVEGELVGEVQLRGSELDPQGQGKLQLNNAKVSGEPFRNFSAQFQAASGTVHSLLNVGAVKADVSFTPKNKAYDLKLTTSKIDLSKSHNVQAKNMPLKGSVIISANGAGTLDSPKLTASVQIDQLQLRDTTVQQVKADLNVADHLAKLVLNSGVGQATIRGNATVRLSPGYYTEASFDTSKFPLDPLLAMYMPSRPSGLHGETELHVSLKGPVADKNKVEAHLTIPSFQTNYQSLELASTGPIKVDYKDELLVLQPGGFKGTDTSLQFQGRVPLNQNNKMSVSAHGSIDLRLVQMFSPDLRTGGTVALDLNAGGTIKNPGMQGQVRLQNASFATEAAPLGVENLNATMQLTDTGVQITNAAGQFGGGQITAGGSVVYRPQLQMNLAVSAKSVRLRYPEGMRTVFNSDLTLTGNQQASLLQGRVLIDALSFTQDFDMSTFMSQFTGTSSPPTGQSFADNLKLQIAVQSTSQLNAGTSQLSIEGQANLQIIGAASDPVVVGRTELTSGDIFFMKRQYHLERGIITFANPNQTEPVLNMLITTTINQYNLSLTIRGPIEKLQTSYVSDPPLPPVDIINLIARGQTTQEGAPTSFGASTVLAQGLGQVGSQVSKLTGVAGLQIDPLIGGDNANPSARIGLQKRVTKNFIFTFSTDVTQPQNEVVQGEYQLTKRWSASVVRNERGGFAVDGKFHTNF
jgi:translocation and assembly module TamB